MLHFLNKSTSILRKNVIICAIVYNCKYNNVYVFNLLGEIMIIFPFLFSQFAVFYFLECSTFSIRYFPMNQLVFRYFIQLSWTKNRIYEPFFGQLWSHISSFVSYKYVKTVTLLTRTHCSHGSTARTIYCNLSTVLATFFCAR